MGKIFLEAQLCGLPAVCFENIEPEDIIRHKIAGYIAKYKNVNDLKSGVEYCLEKKWLKDSIRNFAKLRFDINIVALIYRNLDEKNIMDWASGE